MVTKEKEMEMGTGMEGGKGPVNLEGMDDLSHLFFCMRLLLLSSNFKMNNRKNNARSNHDGINIRLIG